VEVKKNSKCRDTGKSQRDPSRTLGLFQAAPMEGLPGAVFFTGGPVWAMDWRPGHAPSEDLQVVALSSYREIDEVRVISVRSVGGVGLVRLYTMISEAANSHLVGTSCKESEVDPVDADSLVIALAIVIILLLLLLLLFCGSSPVSQTHSLSQRETGPGVVQLWSFLSETGTNPVSCPRLCSLLVLDCGPVMDLQWYPGSLVTSSSDEAASSGRESPGLLAVACGDGSVRVMG